MATLQQKFVWSGLLVLLCLSFSYAHRVILDDTSEDYGKLKATVIGGQDGAGGGTAYGSRNGNGHGRTSDSRVGSGSMAAENYRHAPGTGTSGGSRTGTERVPEMNNLGTPVHPIVPQYMLKSRFPEMNNLGTPVHPIIPQYMLKSRFPEMNNLGTPVHPIIPQYMLKSESTNEDKERSKTTHGEGGEIELAPKAMTKTIHGEGGEIELTQRAMAKNEMKMANVAMKPMRDDDDMELTKQAHNKAGVDG